MEGLRNGGQGRTRSVSEARRLHAGNPTAARSAIGGSK